MNTQSRFCIPCICGRVVESNEREVKCPHCQRLLVVKWGEATHVLKNGEKKEGKA